MRDACKHGQTMFCTDCFTEATEPPTADRDDLAAILDAHEFIPAYHGALSGRCKACHPPELDSMMGANVHRAHVAQMVLESDWLRDVKAEVWDECCKAFGWALDNGTREDALRYIPTHNPYRADRVEDEDGGR